MKKTSGALLAVPLLTSILLTGCTGGTKPHASPSPTTGHSSPTTAATKPPAVTPTADPNVPAAARAHTVAGAEAFVRYYFERLNAAWTVPRAGILSPLCQSSSIACTAFEKTATRLTKEGHRYDGNPVSINFIGVLDATKPGKYDVLANVVQEKRSEIDASGNTVVTDKRKDLRFHFVLSYADQNWSVASLKLVK